MSTKTGQSDADSHRDKPNADAASERELSSTERRDNAQPTEKHPQQSVMVSIRRWFFRFRDRAEQIVQRLEQIRSGIWPKTKNFLVWFRENSQPILVVVTTLILVVYSAQLRQMKKSTRAATLAAKEAKHAVKQARDSEYLDQRPWVTVIYVQLVEAPAVNQFPQVTIFAVNSGKTPALETEFYAKVFIKTFAWPEDVQLESPAWRTSKITVAPGNHPPAQSSFKAMDPINEEQLPLLIEGGLDIYISGAIEYKDHWGKVVHHTYFCFRVSGEDLKRTPTINMNAHAYGNTAD
jgi:hypothetical protein